jgi:N-acetylmuramoyl-L-alanine amidase
MGATMSSTLRAVAVASCSALLVAGAATSAGAQGAAAFDLRPLFGQPGVTITLTGADFSSDTSVTINGVAADDFTMVNSHKVTAVVPTDASSGPVAVTDGVNTTQGPNFTLQQPTSGTSSLSTAKLRFSHTLVVSGYETTTATSKPVIDQDAVLQHRAAGASDWHNAPDTSVKATGPNGGVTWKVQPRANGRYRIHFRQSHAYTGLTTASQPLRVLPLFHLQSLHTASALSTSQVSGSIRPHLTGLVYLQQHINGSWQTVKHATLTGGHFTFAIKPTSPGTLQYRVVRRTDSTHGHATSRTLHVAVVHRTLTIGDAGPDVRTLQDRLHQLRYDVGPRNGSYGYDTLHAVTAFEKVNGLNKDGQTGPKVWAALNHPKQMHLRHPYPNAALAVEINLKKQVLLLAKHGKIWRILDTSTAGGYLYTNSEGGTSRAVTPTGHFTIQYKLTGWHKSDLGELYYPSYFTNTGYAIHGEGNGNDSGEVPPYPNSHGCVRITNDAVLRYYSQLVVGTSVWIY